MPLALGPCCCDCGECDSKAVLGLPDDLTTSFAVLTSTSSGMPADTDIGNCAGGDPYMRWTHSAAIVELLSSIIWDYIESASSTSCGCCCFRYEGRKEYDSECPGGTNDGILLGASPFLGRVVNGTVGYLSWYGNDQNPPETEALGYDICCSTVTQNSPPGQATIEHDFDCVSSCAASVNWVDGDLYTPLNLFISDANLYICVQGSVVTICLSLTIALECQLRTGDGYHHSSYYLFPCTTPPGPPDCCRVPAGWDDTGTYSESCTTNTTSTLSLNATADLTGVAGADIWAKMKAAPAGSWVSDYEHAHCECGPAGCTDSTTVQECDCGIDAGADCQCTAFTGDSACIDGVETADAPVDLNCNYAVGTIDIGFAEA